jgi:hypothetical protein
MKKFDPTIQIEESAAILYSDSQWPNFRDSLNKGGLPPPSLSIPQNIRYNATSCASIGLDANFHPLQYFSRNATEDHWLLHPKSVVVAFPTKDLEDNARIHRQNHPIRNPGHWHRPFAAALDGSPEVPTGAPAAAR